MNAQLVLTPVSVEQLRVQTLLGHTTVLVTMVTKVTEGQVACYQLVSGIFM